MRRQDSLPVLSAMPDSLLLLSARLDSLRLVSVFWLALLLYAMLVFLSSALKGEGSCVLGEGSSRCGVF
jgi:hypothetical protein